MQNVEHSEFEPEPNKSKPGMSDQCTGCPYFAPAQEVSEIERHLTDLECGGLAVRAWRSVVKPDHHLPPSPLH